MVSIRYVCPLSLPPQMPSRLFTPPFGMIAWVIHLLQFSLGSNPLLVPPYLPLLSVIPVLLVSLIDSLFHPVIVFLPLPFL